MRENFNGQSGRRLWCGQTNVSFSDGIYKCALRGGFFISTLSLSETLFLCQKKNLLCLWKSFTLASQRWYTQYMCICLRELSSQRRQSPYLVAKAHAFFPKESLAPQTLCWCEAATPTQCSQNIPILPSPSLCSYSSPCLLFLLSSDFFSLRFLGSK